MTYSATGPDGKALPSWLSFDASTDTLSGVPPDSAKATDITITATDTSGLSASESVSVKISTAAPTGRPVLAHQTAVQTWTEGQAVSLSLVNTFSDPNGETLTYTVLDSDGHHLPKWLHFSTATEILSGTVLKTESKALNLEVIATDSSGLTAIEHFTVTFTKAASQIVGVHLGSDLLFG